MRSYRTIFVPFDFDHLSQLALRAAIDVADRFQAERIHLTHVVTLSGWAFAPSEYFPSVAHDVLSEAIADARAKLAQLEVPLRNVEATREVRSGGAVSELTASAQEQRADLVVIGSHHRGRLGKFVLGSVAGALVRASPCPVLVTGEDRPLRVPINAILAAIDGSAISSEIVDHAARFARQTKARLHVVTAIDPTTALRVAETGDPGAPASVLSEVCTARYREAIEKIVAARCGKDLPTTIDVFFRSDAKNAVLEVAEKIGADLIVMGTSGHNAWERIVLGSTATDVLAKAACPVLVVPFHKVSSDPVTDT
jgi:nucleotide-binding universal stress UspA family protein